MKHIGYWPNIQLQGGMPLVAWDHSGNGNHMPVDGLPLGAKGAANVKIGRNLFYRGTLSKIEQGLCMDYINTSDAKTDEEFYDGAPCQDRLVRPTSATPA